MRNIVDNVAHLCYFMKNMLFYTLKLIDYFRNHYDILKRKGRENGEHGKNRRN